MHILWGSEKRYEVDIVVNTAVIQHCSLSFQCMKENDKIISGVGSEYGGSLLKQGERPMQYLSDYS